MKTQSIIQIVEPFIDNYRIINKLNKMLLLQLLWINKT